MSDISGSARTDIHPSQPSEGLPPPLFVFEREVTDSDTVMANLVAYAGGATEYTFHWIFRGTNPNLLGTPSQDGLTHILECALKEGSGTPGPEPTAYYKAYEFLSKSLDDPLAHSHFLTTLHTVINARREVTKHHQLLIAGEQLPKTMRDLHELAEIIQPFNRSIILPRAREVVRASKEAIQPELLIKLNELTVRLVKAHAKRRGQPLVRSTLTSLEDH